MKEEEKKSIAFKCKFYLKRTSKKYSAHRKRSKRKKKWWCKGNNNEQTVKINNEKIKASNMDWILCVTESLKN